MLLVQMGCGSSSAVTAYEVTEDTSALEKKTVLDQSLPNAAELLAALGGLWLPKELSAIVAGYAVPRLRWYSDWRVSHAYDGDTAGIPSEASTVFLLSEFFLNSWTKQWRLRVSAREPSSCIAFWIGLSSGSFIHPRSTRFVPPFHLVSLYLHSEPDSVDLTSRKASRNCLEDSTKLCGLHSDLVVWQDSCGLFFARWDDGDDSTYSPVRLHIFGSDGLLSSRCDVPLSCLRFFVKTDHPSARFTLLHQ